MCEGQENPNSQLLASGFYDLRQLQVLILCPTRELAVQVSEEAPKPVLF
jgi:superfamily II DNA/RNA helicase